MRFSRRVFLAAPAALAIAVGAIAATGANTGGDWSARRVERLQAKLGLSDDQAKSLQSVFSANAGSHKQTGSDFRQAMTDFRQAALSGDTSTLATKKDAILTAHGQMLDMQATQLQKIGAILTPDQRTKFASMSHGGHRFGRWHGTQQSPDDGNTPDGS